MHFCNYQRLLTLWAASLRYASNDLHSRNCKSHITQSELVAARGGKRSSLVCILSKRWKSSQPVAKRQIEWREDRYERAKLSYYVATRGGKLIGDEPVGVCGFSDSVMIAAAACPAHGDGFLFFHPLAGVRRHSSKKHPLSFFAGTASGRPREPLSFGSGVQFNWGTLQERKSFLPFHPLCLWPGGVFISFSGQSSRPMHHAGFAQTQWLRLGSLEDNVRRFNFLLPKSIRGLYKICRIQNDLTITI